MTCPKRVDHFLKLHITDKIEMTTESAFHKANQSVSLYSLAFMPLCPSLPAGPLCPGFPCDVDPFHLTASLNQNGIRDILSERTESELTGLPSAPLLPALP